MSFFKNLSERRKNDVILVVDGMNTFIRSMSVVKISNDNGIPIGGYAGFLMSIGHAIKTLKPTRCIIVFDGKDGGRMRKEMFSEYKANRTKRTKPRNKYYANVDYEDKSMKFQLGRLMSYLTTLPLQNIIIDYVEADDVIAHIVMKPEFNDSKKYIMSTDKDFLQLIDAKTFVFSPTKKIIIDENLMRNEYNNLIPDNFIILKSIQGDVSDNIPKIKGSGVATLSKYLPILFEDNKIEITDVYDYLSENTKLVDKYKVLRELKTGRELVELNYKLMQLKNPLLSETQIKEIDNLLLSPIPKFDKYSFLRYSVADDLENGIKNISRWADNVFAHLSSYVN